MNSSVLERNIQKSFQEKRISSILQMIIEVEEPTEYQRAAMVQLEHELYQAASPREFKNFSQLAKFLNEMMPPSDSDTLFIKDAFPASKGESPQGSLDCDARTLYALGVLERLEKPFEVYAVSQVDHMLLTDGRKFYDLLDKEIVREPKKDEWSYSIPLMNKNEIYGHLLANKAIFLWKGGGETFYSEQEPYIKQGFEVAKQAYAQNPNNLSLIFNWYKYLNENKSRFKFPQIIHALGVLLGRAERDGLDYEVMSLDEDFYLDTNLQHKKVEKKIERSLAKNKWINYALQRIGNLYGLEAEKFILNIYMTATEDPYGQNQRNYACVLHMLGHSYEEVFAHRNQANEKFEKFIQEHEIEKFPVEDRFNLAMIYKSQIKVSEKEFIDYCRRTFR
jgi:hypothetical protein